MGRRKVTVQLDDDLVASLDALARKRGLSRSELMRQAANRVLESESVSSEELRQIEAYRKHPQDPVLTEALTRLASETAPEW